LQYNIENQSSGIKGVVVLQSLLAPAMQHTSLVGCCVAQSCVPLLQSTIIFVALCNTKSTLVASILVINFACCCHPCDQQHMYYLIVASSGHAMVDSLSLHARLR
jgi:hypothetical protein